MLPKLEGIKAHQMVSFFTNRDAAFAHGEDMADLGWLVSYCNDGNCIAVITTSIEKEAQNCATC